MAHQKKVIALYIRVSTQEQKTAGFSTEAQKENLKRYIQNSPNFETEGKDIKVFEDASTGSDLNREALGRLREQAQKKEIDCIIVWKIDRLSRNLKHLLTLFEEFNQQGVNFISVQENIDFRGAIGNLMFQIFGAIAQFERELIKGRTRSGIIASAEAGNFTRSNIPYGYKSVKNPSGKGKRLEIVPKEKEVIQKIYDWYIYEDLGDVAISKKINKLGIKRGAASKAGDKSKPWSKDMITTIINEPLYSGTYIANTTDEDGNELPELEHTLVAVPPCITPLMFKMAQEIRKQRDSGTAPKHTYLLSGKLKDMSFEPARGFVGAQRTKGGFSYRRKKFKNNSVFEIPGQQLDDYVWETIKDALKNPEVFVQNYLNRKDKKRTRIADLEESLLQVNEQLANFDLKIRRAEQALTSGNFSDEAYKRESTRINRSIEDLEFEKEKLETELNHFAKAGVEIAKLKGVSEKIKSRIDSFETKEKQILCKLFVKEVQVYRTDDKNALEALSRVQEVKLKPTDKVVVNIKLNFNPQTLNSAASRVCTEKPLTEEVLLTLDEKILDSGAVAGI